MAEEPREDAVLFVAILPFDALFELRAHAARRLWRALLGRSPGPPFRPMPDQLRTLHVLSLRTLDARLSGASYRAIAEALFGFHGDSADWENDASKSRVRRLAANGLHMMRGGYRTLLHYPVKIHRG